jgi:ferredoxin, 2Fe-2S
VLAVALMQDVPGLVAECGGGGSCATCQVAPAPTWAERLDPMTGIEAEVLDFAGIVIEGARLACQIYLDDTLHGLVVHVPERQPVSDA